MNMRYVKKSITSAIISGLLAYFLFKTSDLLSKIVISLFLVFAISFCITNVLLVFKKNKLAEKVSKICYSFSYLLVRIFNILGLYKYIK